MENLLTIGRFTQGSATARLQDPFSFCTADLQSGFIYIFFVKWMSPYTVRLLDLPYKWEIGRQTGQSAKRTSICFGSSSRTQRFHAETLKPLNHVTI